MSTAAVSGSAQAFASSAAPDESQRLVQMPCGRLDLRPEEEIVDAGDEVLGHGPDDSIAGGLGGRPSEHLDQIDQCTG